METMEVNGYQQLFGFILYNIFFCVHKNTGLENLEGE